MIKTTRAQRESLKRIYLRDIDTVASNLAYEREHELSLPRQYTEYSWQSYRDMRASIHGGPGCIMIFSRGMWLGIEPDGYTHS